MRAPMPQEIMRSRVAQCKTGESPENVFVTIKVMTFDQIVS